MSDESNTTANSSSSEAIVEHGVEDIAEAAENTEELEATEGQESPELEASAEEAQEPEATEAAEEAIEEEIKELKKKLKIKVDGQEIEEELDWNNEDDLKAKLQKSKAFDKKAQEAAQYRKQMEQVFSALQENPVAVLRELGMDVDSLAAQHLESVLEEASKSPEQIEAEKMKQEYEQLKKEREQLLEEKQAAEKERILNEEASKIENDIVSELEKRNGLLSADDPTAIADISRAMYLAMRKGMTNVQVSDVIEQVETNYAKKLQKRLGSLSKKDVALVEDLLGKEIFDNARKRRVSRKKKAKTETAKQIAKETGKNSENTKVEEPDEKQTYSDFFKPY